MSFFNLPFGIRNAGPDPTDGDRYKVPDNATRDLLITNGRAHEGLQVYVDGAPGNLYLLTTLGVDAGSSVWLNISDISLNPPASGGTPGGTTGAVQYKVDATTFGGEQAFYWDSTAKRLGVNLSNPSYTLHSGGPIYANGIVYAGGSGGATKIVGSTTDANAFGTITARYGSDAEVSIVLVTRGVNIGNFGFGTFNPDEKVQVIGSVKANSFKPQTDTAILFEPSSGEKINIVTGASTSGDLTFVHVSTGLPILSLQGLKIGVGTATPDATFEVAALAESSVKLTSGGTNRASLAFESNGTNAGIWYHNNAITFIDLDSIYILFEIDKSAKQIEAFDKVKFSGIGSSGAAGATKKVLTRDSSTNLVEESTLSLDDLKAQLPIFRGTASVSGSPGSMTLSTKFDNGDFTWTIQANVDSTVNLLQNGAIPSNITVIMNTRGYPGRICDYNQSTGLFSTRDTSNNESHASFEFIIYSD